MTASGATNVQQGVIWGWRTLSSGEPFTGGHDESVSSNNKIMIVMTDGANTYYPLSNNSNRSLYGAYGFSANGRIYDGTGVSATHTSASYTQAMDQHMLITCENAKQAGILIYSIAFEVRDSTTKANMEMCASDDGQGGKLYYDADDRQSLIETFQDIANKITELSITK